MPASSAQPPPNDGQSGAGRERKQQAKPRQRVAKHVRGARSNGAGEPVFQDTGPDGLAPRRAEEKGISPGESAPAFQDRQQYLAQWERPRSRRS